MTKGVFYYAFNTLVYKRRATQYFLNNQKNLNVKRRFIKNEKK